MEFTELLNETHHGRCLKMDVWVLRTYLLIDVRALLGIYPPPPPPLLHLTVYLLWKLTAPLWFPRGPARCFNNVTDVFHRVS